MDVVHTHLGVSLCVCVVGEFMFSVVSSDLMATSTILPKYSVLMLIAWFSDRQKLHFRVATVARAQSELTKLLLQLRYTHIHTCKMNCGWTKWKCGTCVRASAIWVCSCSVYIRLCWRRIPNAGDYIEASTVVLKGCTKLWWYFRNTYRIRICTSGCEKALMRMYNKCGTHMLQNVLLGICGAVNYVLPASFRWESGAYNYVFKF